MTMQQHPIEAKEMKLAELLRTGHFSVPRHQRYYDWEVEHVETLLDDLAEATNEKSPCHFLGSIMLINNDEVDHWKINDGQQRLITFSLVCAYLCKFFAQTGHSSGENHTLRLLYNLEEAHGKSLQDADDLVPRIAPPKNNEANFNALIRGHRVRANGKMVDAWNKIVSFFEETAHQQLAWRQKMLDFMLNNVFVIRLVVDKSLDSNAIFETLNYRGKHVGQMDLIKNHFLQSFNSDRNSAKINTVSDSLEKIYISFNNNVEAVAEYVRCHMQAEAGFINKERFLKETKKRFRASESGKVFKLVGRLSKQERIEAFKIFLRKSASKDFLDELTADARKSNAKRKIRDYLLDMHDYKITRPIMFALFLLYRDESDAGKKPAAQLVYKCAKLLASFMQRTAHVGGFKPSLYEEKFAILAMQISTKACATADAFFAALRDCDSAGITNDKHYIEKLGANFSLRSDKKFAYVVKRIAEHRQPSLKISDNDGQTSIEHVLPLSAVHNSKPAWAADFALDDRARFSRALGNLTVLGKGEDSSKESDNESFVAKKAKIYAKSSYDLTKDLCQHKNWTPKIVKDRQKSIAKMAAKQIWNFQF